MNKKIEKTVPDKWSHSIKKLEHALKFKNKAEQEEIYASAIIKDFEVCFEYAWKSLKTKITHEGIEVYSPREVIKAAARMDIITNAELWMQFLNDRNNSVHDYLGIPFNEYLKTIESFLIEVKKLHKKLG